MLSFHFHHQHHLHCAIVFISKRNDPRVYTSVSTSALGWKGVTLNLNLCFQSQMFLNSADAPYNPSCSSTNVPCQMEQMAKHNLNPCIANLWAIQTELDPY